MREIKFRVWDKKKKVMDAAEEISFVSSHDEYGDEGGLPYSVKIFDGKYYSILPPDSFELMQFTGLRDKSGKEIYEGDIINTAFAHDKQVVWFDKNTATFFLYASAGKTIPLNRSRPLEVLGNIYERPDLI